MAKAAAGLRAVQGVHLLNVHHCLKIKRGEKRTTWKILQGQQMAGGGLMPGQGGLGKDRTNTGMEAQPRKEKASGMFCSTEVTEKAPGVL